MNIVSEDWVKTRKKHYCIACNRRYPAGVKMHVQVISDGGEINRIYYCEECKKILDGLTREEKEELYEPFSDSFNEGALLETFPEKYEGKE